MLLKFLIILWSAALGLVTFAPRMVYIDCIIDNKLTLYRHADEASVVNGYQIVWSAFLTSMTCLGIGLGINVADEIVRKRKNYCFGLGHVAAWVIVLWTILPLLDSRKPTRNTNRVLHNNALSNWAFCGTPLDSTKKNLFNGKIGFGYDYDYDGGVIIQPAPAMQTIAREHVLVEVIHSADPILYSADQAWHYVMPGSGVYANFSKILSYATHYPFVRDMGFDCSNYQCTGDIDKAFSKAKALGYDAVQFTKHADNMCGNLFAEIVAFANGSTVCPIQYYDENGEKCQCNPEYGTNNCGKPLNTAEKFFPPVVSFFVPVFVSAGAFFVFKKMLKKQGRRTLTSLLDQDVDL